MSSNPLRLRFLFEKYLENACTKQELEEFWKLMAELSDEDLIETDLKRLWKESEGKDQPAEIVDWDAAYVRLQQKIEDQKPDYARVISIRRNYLLKIAVAASLLICIGLAYLVFRESPSVELMQQAQNNATFQTIRLPDGTTVTLNRKSKLSYPVRFNGPTREVYLTGEAFFDVAHNKDKPFMVHTGIYVTKVLGTAFNIRAYDADVDVSVTVTRGKVQVQNDKDPHKKSLGVLLPGEQLTINKISAAATLVRTNVDTVLEWKNDDLNFENVTFERAAQIFSRHYGIPIQFKNQTLLNCRFTGDFNNDNIAQALDVVCALTNATWRKDENGNILIEGKGCK